MKSLKYNKKIGIIYNLTQNNEVKEKADFDKLRKYTKKLNQHLRDDFEFEENQRPLVVSGILLALEDESFISGYIKKKKPIEIAHLLINTIKERLVNDNIGEIKRKTMIQTYDFMRSNTKIINEENKNGIQSIILKNLVKEVEENIKPFLKHYKQYDAIGMFYNEFLRYANGDGGLGIVLTPKHITELFVELAEINKDSVVFDNCCGTGGFLISSMKKMEDLSCGDSQKIHKIHKKQLIGIESNSKMFCLACSNMMLRGDGKSNIHQKDCFQIEEEKIKKLKPNVALLNPPYSKENGHKELEFVWNALCFLEPSGLCIAIVPQSCAMNTKEGNLNVKERILKKHTLKAVMSMPNNLFDDSEKSSVTCIMVFEAHKPHSQAPKTWFGYWKDDGFKKKRPFGRIDLYERYKKEIKKKWIDSYRNKKEIKGFCLLQNVGAEDEWLVEAYLKTNFERLKDNDFIASLKDYSTFLFYNGLRSIVSSKSFSMEKLNLDFTTWKPIRLGWEKSTQIGLFEVKGSKTTSKNVLDMENTRGNRKYPYLTTQATNNGVRDWYNSYTDKGNILTVDSAVTGYCAYQMLDFTASDHVEKLIPKFKLNVFTAAFLTTVINLEGEKISYGRKFNQIRIRATKIKLPFKNRKIDWEFMEEYIKGLPYSKCLELK